MLILSLMPATRLKEGGTGKTKDWEGYGRIQNIPQVNKLIGNQQT